MGTGAGVSVGDGVNVEIGVEVGICVGDGDGDGKADTGECDGTTAACTVSLICELSTSLPMRDMNSPKRVRGTPAASKRIAANQSTLLFFFISASPPLLFALYDKLHHITTKIGLRCGKQCKIKTKNERPNCAVRICPEKCDRFCH